MHKYGLVIHYILITILIGFNHSYSQIDRGKISGQVINSKTNQPLKDCNVVIRNIDKGKVTDDNGLFIFRVTPGKYEIEFSYIGFNTLIKNIEITDENSGQRLVINMIPVLLEEEAITVYGALEKSNIEKQQIKSLDIKRMPLLYSDALRSVKILPGVTSNNELSNAYNVRGGNFDENLIYLNGYEIYRPFLLRKGVEENQSLLNADMIKTLHLYTGAFPANLGDKMSSALEVEYRRSFEPQLSGVIRGNVMNMGLTLQKRFGKLNFAVGARYANPSLFVKKMQTSGNYRPEYSDIQALLNYSFSDDSNLELFLLGARNRFNVTPDSWTGHFKFNLVDIREISIDYNGQQLYSFNTGLLGLRYKYKISNQTNLSLSASSFLSDEDEDTDLQGNVFYSPDAYTPQRSRTLLKSRNEKIDNWLNSNKYEFNAVLNKWFANHKLSVGLSTRLQKFSHHLDEFFIETSDSSFIEQPLIQKSQRAFKMDQYSGFIQDNAYLSQKLKINIGMRFIHNEFSKENLFSPRAALYYFPDSSNSLQLRWGHYKQPPDFSVLSSMDPEKISAIKSQKSQHFILGWNYKLNTSREFQIEMFYKKLDDLIPFYLEQVKPIYFGENTLEGFAYGADLSFQGDILPGLNSWINYSYLNTKEKAGSGKYKRRLLDQTHTIRIFLQDRMPKFPQFLAHLRMLYGSGLLYHPRKVVAENNTGLQYLSIDFSKRKKYQFFARFDLGFSAKLKFIKNLDTVFNAEILNLFNNTNVAGYSWVQPFTDSNLAIRIPHVFTSRFYNLGFEVQF